MYVKLEPQTDSVIDDLLFLLRPAFFIWWPAFSNDWGRSWRDLDFNDADAANQGDAAVSHRIGDLKLVAVAALGRKPA